MGMRGQQVTNGRTIMERCRTFAYFSDGTHAHQGMSSAKAVRGQGSSRARRMRRATYVLAREEHGLADAQARRPATAPSSRTRRRRARPSQAPEASQRPWRGVAQTAIRPDCFQPGSPSQRVESESGQVGMFTRQLACRDLIPMVGRLATMRALLGSALALLLLLFLVAFMEEASIAGHDDKDAAAARRLHGRLGLQDEDSCEAVPIQVDRVVLAVMYGELTVIASYLNGGERCATFYHNPDVSQPTYALRLSHSPLAHRHSVDKLFEPPFGSAAEVTLLMLVSESEALLRMPPPLMR